MQEIIFFDRFIFTPCQVKKNENLAKAVQIKVRDNINIKSKSDNINTLIHEKIQEEMDDTPIYK